MAPNNSRFDNVLTLLVEFAGTENGKTGPLHNQIPEPGPAETGRFWMADFAPAHYRNMLFNRRPGARSMANYYLEQSGGLYTVDGAVYGWIQLPHSEWFYGANDPNGSGDDQNGPVWRVVADAAESACGIPWKQFDKEDPYDIDGDGNVTEPDGYVDHLQVVHAGMGEEVGGGAQGEDAIWSHSWFVNFGEASTAFWTLMSSGSYLACPDEPDGTCPAPMGIWEKWVLGWVKPEVVLPSGSKRVTLRQATASGPANKAIQVRLPD